MNDVGIITKDDILACPVCFAIVPSDQQEQHVGWHVLLRKAIRLAGGPIGFFGEPQV